MWIACAGALLVMALVIYLAIGRERGGEAGQLLMPPSSVALITIAAPPLG